MSTDWRRLVLCLAGLGGSLGCEPSPADPNPQAPTAEPSKASEPPLANPVVVELERDPVEPKAVAAAKHRRSE